MPRAKKSKKPIESVELLDAFMWICGGCGKKNFVQAVTVEMSEEDKKEIFSLEPWEETPPGDFLSMPEIVACDRCKKRYATKDPYDSEGDEPDA
jgi:hypothetical protein